MDVSERRDAGSPLAAELEIVRRVVDGALVIAAVGDVDPDTAPALSTAVIAGIDQAGRRPCVLDLTGVTFLDSSGLNVLLAATNHSAAHRRQLPIVVDGNRPVIRPIQVTGLDNALALYHTVDEALLAQDR